MTRSVTAKGLILAACLLSGSALAQTLRFDTYHEPQPLPNANVQIGPYSLDLVFEQSVGYRYTRSSGEGATYLYGEDLGRYRKDGSDFPLVSRLGFRNYLIISKYMDLDLSFDLRYSFFPMGTEDNESALELTGPGLSAQMGSFTFGMTEGGWLGSYNGAVGRAYSGSEGYGFLANLSTTFQVTPLVRGRLYDNPSYRVEYVDERGYADAVSGEKYPVFQNVIGVDLDWLLAKNKNLAYSASRTDTVPQDTYEAAQKSVIYRQSLAYQQQLNPVAAGGARADYTWRDYSRGRGYQSQQDYIGFLNMELTEDTSLMTTLGYSMADLKDAGSYETNGTSDAVIGSVDLTSRLSETLSHRIGYSRQQRAGFQAGLELVDALNYALTWNKELWTAAFRTSYQTIETRLSGASNYRDWVNQLSATRSLSPDLTLTLATAYTLRENDTIGEGGIGEGVPMLTNNYDTWASNIGLTYVLAEHWTAYAYAEHLARFSDDPQLAFDRDTVGTTLVYRYDF